VQHSLVIMLPVYYIPIPTVCQGFFGIFCESGKKTLFSESLRTAVMKPCTWGPFCGRSRREEREKTEPSPMRDSSARLFSLFLFAAGLSRRSPGLRLRSRIQQVHILSALRLSYMLFR